MWYSITFGKSMLIILSPHSINSDIHFVQGLLSLGCQKKTVRLDLPKANVCKWWQQPLNPSPTSRHLSTQTGRKPNDLQSGVLKLSPLIQATFGGKGGN